MGTLQNARQLEAAGRCLEAFLHAGSSRLSVEELCAAAGISKRTFHRYFPYKAQVIRPYYAAMTAALHTLIDSGRLHSIQSWKEAWSTTVLGDDPARSVELFRLIRADAELWSVFLEVIEDSERSFAEAFASGQVAPSTSKTANIDADVLAVSIAASSRLALHAATDTGSDPAESFAAYLRKFIPSLR